MSDGEHRIRERAHQLWEHAGRPDHRSDEFWAQAEAEVKREHAKPAPDAKETKKSAPAKKAPSKAAKAEATAKPVQPPVEKPISVPPKPPKPKVEAKAPTKPKSKK